MDSRFRSLSCTLLAAASATLLDVASPNGIVEAQSAVPSVERIVFLGLAAGDSTYFRGEALRVRVAFTRHIVVSTTNGEPYVELTVGTNVRRARFVASKLNRLDFSYTVQSADYDADGVSVAANALKLNGALIKAKDNPTVDANAAHDAVAGGAARKVDGNKARPPKIRSVTFNNSPTTGNTYGYGEAIAARVAFDRPVLVSTTDGTPRLALTVGAHVRQATLLNSAGTHRRLNFSYVVQGNDRAATGVAIAADALNLNGGTIKASVDSTTDAMLAHSAVAADSTRKIDGRRGRPPKIDRIAFVDPEPKDSTYWRGDTIVVRVGFDATVAVDTTNGKPQVGLTIGTATRQAVFSTRGNESLDFSYVVQSADADADGAGIAANALALNGSTITGTGAAASRAADLVHPSVDGGETRKVDGSQVRAPTINSVVFAGPPPDGGTYHYGKEIVVRVAFDRGVVVDTAGGKPQLEVTVGALRRQAVVAAPAGTASVLDFTYRVKSADLDLDGASIAANALALNGGTIKAATDGTTAASLAHSAVAAATARKVDGRPRIAAIEFMQPPGHPPPPQGIFKFRETMWIGARFDQEIAMTGTPRIPLVVGTDTVQVAAKSRARQNHAVVFQYKVQRGLKDPDGVSVPRGALDLNGGTLKAASDNVTNANLDHGGAPPNASYKVDGNLTPVPGARIVWDNRPASGDTFGQGESIRIKAVFHTRVVVTGRPQLSLKIGTQTKQLTATGSDAWGVVFAYVVQSTDVDSDGVSVPANTLSLPSGTTIQAVADPSIAAALAHDSLPANTSRKVNGNLATAPIVRWVSIGPDPSSDSTYTLHEQFNVTVTFDRAVVVDTTDGKPRIALDIGNSTRYAMYSHAHNSSAAVHVFNYTVQAPDVDSDGISIAANALSANGGSITASGETAAADLSHNALAADSARKVNGGRTSGPRPRWLWFSSAPASGDTYRQGESIKVTLSFDRKAAVDATGGVPYVEIDVGGTRRRASYAGGSSPRLDLRFAYVVQAADVDSDGVSVPANTLTANGASITGVPGATVAILSHDSLPANAAHKVNGGLPPRIRRMSIDPGPSSDSTYTLHEQFNVSVGFDRAVVVDTTNGRPRIALDIGGSTRYATYSHAHNSSAALHVFNYTVQASDVDADGISIAANALSANGGSITAPGETVAADLSHEAVAADSARKVNGGRTGSPRPRWLWFSSAPASGDTYRQGESIQVTLSFDRKASVDTAGGVPYVEIDVGGTRRRASYVGGSSPRSDFRFAYVVQAADMDSDGVSVPANTLTANGGSITGVPGATVALLSHDSLPANAAHKVNGTPAGVSTNRKPEVIAPMAPKAFEVGSGPVADDLSAYFRDPDGDELGYVAVSAAQAVATAVIAGNVLTIRPQAVGQSLVTIRVADPAGAEAEQSFLVTVEASRSDRARILKQSLAAFGRTVGTEAVDAIGGRLGAGDEPSAHGRSHFQLGGRSLSCDAGSSRHGCGLLGLAHHASGLLGVRLAPSMDRLASALPDAASAGLDADAARGLERAFGQPGFGTGGVANAAMHNEGVRWRRLLSLNPLSRRELLSRASFRFSPGGGGQAGDGGQAGGGQAEEGGWTFWGRANTGGFEGRPADDLALDATVWSAYLGADYRFGPGPLVGLALSRTTSDIGFESGINGTGTVDASLTSLYPYVQWSPRTGLNVWGLLGAGRGDAAMSEDVTGRRFETKIGMFMTAVGARQRVVGALAFKADALAVRTDANETADLAGVAANAYRLRLAPEVGGRWAVSEQASVRSRAELGVRIDGGDAETGVGAEAGAELTYAHEGIGLHVGFRGRTLVAHQADAFKDWGASMSVRLQPGRGAGGLSLRLEPTWGNVASGMATLWRDGTVGPALGRSLERSPTARGEGRLDVETGYAIVVPDFGKIEPFGRWALEHESGYRLNVGVRLSAASRANFDLFGEQATRGVDTVDRRLGLRGAIQFK